MRSLLWGNTDCRITHDAEIQSTLDAANRDYCFSVCDVGVPRQGVCEAIVLNFACRGGVVDIRPGVRVGKCGKNGFVEVDVVPNRKVLAGNGRIVFNNTVPTGNQWVGYKG